jgi:hypothetical protein
MISLSAKRVQRNIAAYYQLPIPERCEAYKELREHNTLEQRKLVESFLAKHGQLTPEQQLARLFPSTHWENAERHNAADALVYIASRSDICDLFGKEMDEMAGKVITEEDLFSHKFKKLAGSVALIARPEEQTHDLKFIIERELDHVYHLQLPCKRAAKQAEDEYRELKPRFFKGIADANNGAADLIGIDTFEIIQIRKNGPRMLREGNAPILINNAVSALMQFMAYQLLFEASAVLSSLGSFMEGKAGSCENIRKTIEKGGLEWALGIEIKDVTRPIAHMGFNFSAVRRTFPRDKDLVGTIDHFEYSSTGFAYRIAKLMTDLRRDSPESEVLKVMARATQILSYEELTVGSEEETAKAILLTKLSAY